MEINYQDLKNNYREECISFIINNRDKIIDAFAEYYGEEYRDQIEYKFNHTVFLFYFAINQIKKLLTIAEKKKIDEIIIEKYKLVVNLYDLLPDDDKKSLNCSVYFSGEDMICDDRYKSGLLFPVINQFFMPSSLPFFYNGTVYNAVYIPLLNSNFHCFIHEINHSVTNNIIAYIQDDIGFQPLAMGGATYRTLDKENSNDNIVEELLNDLSTIDLVNILKKKNIKKCMVFTYVLSFPNIYEYNYFLATELYEEFRDLIKKARIENNRNLLINGVGEDNYLEYVSLVKKYYSIDDKISDEQKEKAKTEISSVIKKMKEHYRENNISDIIRRSK